MLHFTNALLIYLLLLQFPFSVAVDQWCITVGFGIRVENLDIKECLLLPISPKSPCLKASSRLIDGGCTNLFHFLLFRHLASGCGLLAYIAIARGPPSGSFLRQ